jgi:tRNA1(Val) A37 N6-methylase TrmN6
VNSAEPALEWSDDGFLGGRMTLRQWRKGHRAGSDAVLLAASVPANLEGLIVDAGAASGAVGLMAAMRATRARVELVEIDASECELARHNVTANGLDQRCRVISADLLSSEAEREQAGLAKNAAQCVVSNPPFLNEAAARLSPDPNRARAHALPPDGLERWCRSLAWLAAPDAMIALIHRADALKEILDACEGRFGALTVRPVQPYAQKPATRLLVNARKGSRAKLSLLPPLILHEADGRFTEESERFHAGNF